MKKPVAVIVVIFVILSVGGLAVYLTRPKVDQNQLYYSGTIESTSSNLSFQVSGKIKAVMTDEGHRVTAGVPLAEVDDALYQAKAREAAAMLDQSQKNLERIGILLEVYSRTLPADVKRARAGLNSAQAMAKEARNDKDRFDGLIKNSVVSQRDWEAINLKHETLESQLAEAKAILDQAQSNLKKIELTRKEIQVAQTHVDAAKSAVDAAQIQLGYTKLYAPFDGIITTRNMEPGEVVSPGQEVLSLSNLTTVELKIYVGEEDIGRVSHGAEMEVSMDTYPDRIYQGRVSFIATEAEFTPKIIQTHKERVKLVYMVKLSIPNADFSLKPGMPADACFQLK
ncbi:MAG: efflux RND transporter periplasmic adaptor subunit [Proteobacteria bacterium]|nr:efflux RND transporter periplasmic adaptor subunit [Pseudomonadota bacterium]MBU4469077.1 efflux RND transporter periplasmic adaptor subunit [Pseudomonadota bacterium]MCG2751049.1 efflux RND transporter periplasmic adaptor subunit [Desulfobacteraceae bacterium]